MHQAVVTERDQALVEFGRRVRERRSLLRDPEGRAVSQERAADLAGLHRTYWGHVERGEVNVALRNILRIAQTLEVDAGDLLAGLQDHLDA